MTAATRQRRDNKSPRETRSLRKSESCFSPSPSPSQFPLGRRDPSESWEIDVSALSRLLPRICESHQKCTPTLRRVGLSHPGARVHNSVRNRCLGPHFSPSHKGEALWLRLHAPYCPAKLEMPRPEAQPSPRGRRKNPLGYQAGCTNRRANPPPPFASCKLISCPWRSPTYASICALHCTPHFLPRPDEAC